MARIGATKRLIVLDTCIKSFQRNRIFDPDFAANFPGAMAVVRLREAAELEGFEMVTSDIYAAMSTHPSTALCISDRVTSFVSPHLRSGKLRGAVLCNFESPNVDLYFYHTLRSRSKLFRHAILFGGARDRVASGTIFHPAYFPQPHSAVVRTSDWSKRQWLAMVVSNKQAAQSQGTSIESFHPLRLVKRSLRTLLNRYILMSDRRLRVKDLYRIRLEAAYYFSKRSGFRLFGRGWDQKIYGVPDTYDIAIRDCWGGAIEDKLSVLSNFRFALCFENCVFPGYVTEKIFDCLFAGCIPVYYGAPDVADFVPSKCFIACRNIGSLSQLEEYLYSVRPEDAEGYLQAASSYFASEGFKRFHQDSFVTTVLSCVKDTLER